MRYFFIIIVIIHFLSDMLGLHDESAIPTRCSWSLKDDYTLFNKHVLSTFSSIGFICRKKNIKKIV